ncbi:MAG: hypothetical protein IK129_03260 [Deltaproteobacteria bacterium]|jgi:hypothetical protein|nr:hypothetical protein [Deltaproteobacteria bacterium]MBR5346643.1 hypothetical protein [Deltaproteobacteria bacterium]MBR5704515.1 hypothetical protein [Deltaproteobacteria bacterium]MCR5221088.1 hypothetical protein [bacterium]
MKSWKMIVVGACAGLLLVAGCTANLSSADRAKVDEAIAAGQKAADAAEEAKQAALRAEEAAQLANSNAQASKKAFERGLRK